MHVLESLRCFDFVRVFALVLVLFVELSAGALFTDLWAVHVNGGDEVANEVARRHGFINRGQIMPDYYHFQHRKVAKRSTFASTYYHQPLQEDGQVLWAEQQVARVRKKRGFHFNDPKWPVTWYLNDHGNGMGMNVREAWDMGFTGKGVVVTILDDGIEKDHPDLIQNYTLKGLRGNRSLGELGQPPIIVNFHTARQQMEHTYAAASTVSGEGIITQYLNDDHLVQRAPSCRDKHYMLFLEARPLHSLVEI
ncbi:hypothetical protein RRG08_026919 [Elysia crispata]|uniref:Peptidase S8 pro-domain domain-containing protein n=1 Tax=Elysia crispata TaxID=231223 RepID=A0AAE1DA55_9GAST|nr:hypothetical protein RRG08_026919 [Elysia crispata]